VAWDVITSGYVSLDRIVKIQGPARVGLTSLITNADNARVYYGGCSINIAWQLARLGLRTLPIVRVGDDYEASGFRDFLERGGVSTDAVELVHGDTTSNCYLIEDPVGQHIALFYTGAQDRKHFRPMPDRFFQEARLGVLTVGASPDNVEFFEKCRKWGVEMVFGMKADFDAFPSGVLADVLRSSSVIFTNEAERAEIERRLGLVSITDLLDAGKARVIVTTRGAEGSTFQEKRDGAVVTGHVGVARCSAIVDTTGSGDAFIAGFLYGLLRGRDTEFCCKLGSVMASFAIESMGCCTGAPTEPELLQRLNEEK
jgi:sugar/nucleoside kinase (ribokinase family)